jgi:uncharacterized membrane protein
MKIESSVLILLTLLLTLNGAVYGVDQVEYTIYINNEGSATWTIIRVLEPDSSYIYENFLNNLTKLVEKTENKTGREMTVWVEINILPQDTYIVVKYIIRWENFCKVNNSKLIISDVFRVDDFFSKLYGNGVVYLIYPTEYSVEAVSPKPDEQDDTHQMLKWFKSKLFSTQTTNIVLTRKNSSEYLEFLKQNAVPIVSIITIVSFSLILLYLFRLQKKAESAVTKHLFPTLLEMENNEEKIIRMLKSGGGTLYQSQISEKCGFSRAKTSQLLKFMEKKGIVKRKKKGRGKIVTLVREVGENE